MTLGANEIPFNDPRVCVAIEEFGACARNVRLFAVRQWRCCLFTDLRDSPPKPLPRAPPQCYSTAASVMFPASP